MAGPDDIARSVAAQNAYGSIYGAQYSDAQKSARANEMARRLGIPADIVEADYPNMMAEDRLRQAQARAEQNPAYATMMANPRFAAAAIDDQSIHPLADALTQHTQQQEHRPESGFRSILRGIAAAASPFVPGALALAQPSSAGAGSFLAASIKSGLHSFLGAGGKVLDAINPFTTSEEDVAALYKNDPAGLARVRAHPWRYGIFLSQAANDQQRAANRSMQEMSPEAQRNYGSLAYATTDPNKAAYLSPIKLLGDTLNSLPSTAALALTAYVTRGASLEAEQAALAGGATQAAARAAGVHAAERMATRVGAASEGTIGAAQQDIQTEVQLEDQPQAKWDASPQYQKLIKQGYDPAAAKLYLSTRAGREAGYGAGGVDAITNLLGGPILGRIIGEGGSLIPRILRGAALEGVTEGVQGAGEQFSQNLATQRNVDPNQSLTDQVAENALQGLFVGGLTGGAFSGAFGHAAEQRHAQEAAANIDRVMNAAAQSSTRTSNPSDFETVLNQQLDGRPGDTLYIPAEKVQALFQDQPPGAVREDPFWGQYAAQLDQASAIGGDVVVPLSQAATHLAGSPQWQSLREHVRATPGGMSLAEAKQPQSEAELTDAATRIVDHLDSVVPHLEAARETRRFVGKLGLEGAEAEAAAQLLARHLAVATALENQKRAGRGEAPLSPTEMFKRWNLKAEKGAEAAFEASGQKAAAQSASPFAAKPTGQPVGGYYATDAAGNILVRPDHPYGNSPNRFKTEAAAIKAAPKMVTLASLAPAKSSTLSQTARGNISIVRDPEGRMTGAVIRAFESANFSTFVHELGHFQTEDLRQRATAPDATEQEKADYEALREWWKAELGVDVAPGDQIPVEAHELTARGMERYIYEGKAPSRTLKALFAKMRDWMVELYRTVAAFNSPITPEVRQVFDRLYAGNEEIVQQRADLALASKNIEALMTPAEHAEYQRLADEGREQAKGALYERILSSLRRDRTQEASARKREIAAQVADAVDATPPMQALRLLRSGVKLDDGTTERVRLSRQWLIDNYGDAILGQLPKGIQPVYADTETVDAEDLAQRAGFDSADQMVKALTEIEAQRTQMQASGDKRSPRQRMIDEEAQQRIAAEIGDPFQNIEEEAQAALANERQADLMSMELRALSRKTGRRPTPWKMAVAWAEGHIAQQRNRDAITGSALQMYARNAGKAGRTFEEALVKGDMEAAFQAKQQQLLNMALLQEAKKAKDNVEGAVRRLQKVATAATIKSVDQDYLDQAHQLLESVDMKTAPLSRVDKRQAFERWYQDQVEHGVEPVVPIEYRSILGKTNWQQLTVSDLLDLDQVVKQIMDLGRLKQKIRDGRELRDFHEVVGNLQQSAEAQRQIKRPKANDPSRILTERIKSRIRGADAALIKMETICDWLDGNNPNGPWNRAFMWVLSNAQGREADLATTYATELNDLIKAVPRQQARRWSKWVDAPELVNNIPAHPERGEPMRFGMDQIVMMAMNWGNEGNRQRLLDGFGWEEGNVKGVLDRLMTKEDWDFVQGAWQTVDKLWPEVEALERRVNGVAPEKIKGVSVQTPHGTYEGGYFPVVYDPTYSTTTQLQQEDKLSPNGGFFRVSTRAGSTNERVAAVKGRPLLLDLGVITSHMREVIHDITHREAVQQSTRLLSDKRVRTSVTNALGPEYLKTMEAVVNNVARPGQANSRSNPAIVKVARWLNKGVSTVGLGFRISTILQQPVGLSNMAGVVGERAVAEGMATAIASPLKTYNEVIERSAEMRHRFSTVDATIHEMYETHARGKLALLGPGKIEKTAFQGIAFFDGLITVGGWIGAYNKALREKMTEEEAVHYADKVIRTSQGAGGSKDQAPVQFDHVFVKAFVPFFSYLNANYNQRRDVGHRLRRAESAGDVADAARRYWWVAIAPSIAMALLFGKGPDDTSDEGWMHYLSLSVILGGLQPLPGIGNLANALGYGYGYRATPWQQVGETTVQVAKDAKGAATGEPVSKNWVRDSMYVAGIATGKPLGQLGSTAQGLHDYATGEADPHGVRDWYHLLTEGRVPQPAQ